MSGIDAMNVYLIPVAKVAVIILGLDAWALWKLAKSTMPTRQQKIFQALLVLLIPILGAAGILIFLKPGKDYDRGDFPRDPGINPNITGVDTRGP